ncbi:lengsin-like [Amphiura filiformis]|uniref:lengsin-like n=1 Tax=Amphiura filiformis TaxID=82378 RepID=UPI003B225E7B
MEVVLREISKRMTQFVRFEFGDIYGVARSKIVPARHFREKAVEGIYLPLADLLRDPQGTLVYGNKFTDAIGFADGLWFPDFNTFRALPWDTKTATIVIEPTYKGEPVTVYPRYIAKQQFARLKQMNISLASAHEHEFWIMDRQTRKPLTPDVNVCSTLRNYEAASLVEQLMSDLYNVGVDVQSYHTEHGPGQLEINYHEAFGILAADNAHVYKTAVKEIAQRNGYIASFMSKPFIQYSGSSGFICHSLWDTKTKRGLLYDPDSPDGISELGRYWIAGLLYHAPGMCVFMAPTVNCFKRFGKNPFTPGFSISWGIDNRTCTIRARINGEQGTYVEQRMAASACNPYLSLAAIIAAGIDGIQRKLTLPMKVTGNSYAVSNLPQLPTTMGEAMDAFNKDNIIKDAFGEDFCDAFLALKMHEIRSERDAKTNMTNINNEWDRKMFFEYM